MGERGRGREAWCGQKTIGEKERKRGREYFFEVWKHRP
jgi:hypothetical protein